MRRLALIIGGAILVAPYSCSALAGTVNGFVRDRAMTGNGKTNSASSHSLIATGMDGQKEKGQKAVDQQPVTKEKQAAPSQSQPGSLVTRVGLKADGNNTGRCPLTVNFTGFITTNGSGDVQYTFIRSDGIAGPVLSAHFKDAGTQAVTTSWGLGEGSDQPHYEGWAAIRILSPNQLESSHETGSFSITCAPRSVARVGDASASPLLRGTFEVILLGFTVDRQTRDDSLQRDGAGDEVFLVSPSDFLIDTSSREIRRSVGGHGAVYGQRRSSSSAVIQAGTASETGGLRTGDQFPQPTPWVYRNDGIAGDAITHVFFLGEITQGANVLAVIPSLWEWDNNDEGIQHSYVDMMADQNLARAVSPFIARSPTSLRDSIKTFSELGLPLRLSIGHGPLGLGEVNNRPIGMVRSGDRYTFDPQVLILTYQMADMIARTDFGKGNGVIEMRYKDDADLEGAYTLYLKVVRLP